MQQGLMLRNSVHVPTPAMPSGSDRLSWVLERSHIMTNRMRLAESDCHPQHHEHLQVLLSVAVWARLEVLHILGLERASLDGQGKHSQQEARTPPASKAQHLLSISSQVCSNQVPLVLHAGRVN